MNFSLGGIDAALEACLSFFVSLMYSGSNLVQTNLLGYDFMLLLFQASTQRSAASLQLKSTNANLFEYLVSLSIKT